MDVVRDDEVLFRCVKHGEGYTVNAADGKVVFSSSVFADRTKRPSVNRAELCDNDPLRTKVVVSDGVTSVITGDVRATEPLIRNDAKGHPISTHLVDVEPVPLANRPEHAEIFIHPEGFMTACISGFCVGLPSWQPNGSGPRHQSEICFLFCYHPSH